MNMAFSSSPKRGTRSIGTLVAMTPKLLLIAALATLVACGGGGGGGDTGAPPGPRS